MTAYGFPRLISVDTEAVNFIGERAEPPLPLISIKCCCGGQIHNVLAFPRVHDIDYVILIGSVEALLHRFGKSIYILLSYQQNIRLYSDYLKLIGYENV